MNTLEILNKELCEGNEKAIELLCFAYRCPFEELLETPQTEQK